MPNTLAQSLKKSSQYGLPEFLDLIGEISQLSARKGALDRKSKELITLGIAIHKQCRRCINIHTHDAKQHGATEDDIRLVQKTCLFLAASPASDNKEMWQAWSDSWHQFVLSKGDRSHKLREFIAIGIAIVRQSNPHIVLHITDVKEHGATMQEIFEIVPIALLMDGAPAISQVPRVVDALEAAGYVE
jgi:AhpD family alkylhydroperoxidase